VTGWGRGVVPSPPPPLLDGIHFHLMPLTFPRFPPPLDPHSGPEALNPPLQQQLHHEQYHQGAGAWGTPSQDDHACVVTPGGSRSFVVDPPPAAPHLRQNQFGGVSEDDGDLSGELDQVQRMLVDRIAQDQAQDRQQQQVTPPPPLPVQQNNNQHHQQRPRLQTQHQIVGRPPLAAVAASASATVPLQQPQKRPRVTSTGGGVAHPPAKIAGGAYSFASSSSSASTLHRHIGVGGGGVAVGRGGGSVSFAQSGGIGHQGRSGAAVGGPSPPPSFLEGLVGGRQKSQAQQDRRRERNRILARRTRLRKKFFFESLQKDVSDLQRENATLKSIVRSRLRPDDAAALLEGCDANDRLPVIDLEGLIGADGPSGDESTGGGGDVTRLDREDFSLIRSIQNSQQCFIITDPSLHDNPIVYASDDFLTLTGYSQEEVLGRNCRFLQGTGTDPSKVKEIRDAVVSGEDCSVTLVNYTSDGEPFWNSLFVAALRDADNNIVNFIGVIVKVAGPEKGDSEYGKVLK
jgi:PAS domain S-box-containing protein